MWYFSAATKKAIFGTFVEKFKLHEITNIQRNRKQVNIFIIVLYLVHLRYNNIFNLHNISISVLVEVKSGIFQYNIT